MRNPLLPMGAAPTPRATLGELRLPASRGRLWRGRKSPQPAHIVGSVGAGGAVTKLGASLGHLLVDPAQAAAVTLSLGLRRLEPREARAWPGAAQLLEAEQGLGTGGCLTQSLLL